MSRANGDTTHSISLKTTATYTPINVCHKVSYTVGWNVQAVSELRPRANFQNDTWKLFRDAGWFSFGD